MAGCRHSRAEMPSASMLVPGPRDEAGRDLAVTPGVDGYWPRAGTLKDLLQLGAPSNAWLSCVQAKKHVFHVSLAEPHSHSHRCGGRSTGRSHGFMGIRIEQICPSLLCRPDLQSSRPPSRKSLISDRLPYLPTYQTTSTLTPSHPPASPSEPHGSRLEPPEGSAARLPAKRSNNSQSLHSSHQPACGGKKALAPRDTFTASRARAPDRRCIFA
ncbi:hypothetical protein F4780DRAFT_607501 [Xylariomycetidae sp. FL0641]|nr:hypothetical protein F4780DRAFT_607501 [Xylariomycetidae sp. FL0641]